MIPKTIPFKLILDWITQTSPKEAWKLLKDMQANSLDMVPLQVQLVTLDGGWGIGLRSMVMPSQYCDVWVAPFNTNDWCKSLKWASEWETFVYYHKMNAIGLWTKEYGIRLPTHVGQMLRGKRVVYQVSHFPIMRNVWQDPKILAVIGTKFKPLHLFAKNVAPLGPFDVQNFKDGKLDDRLC